MTLVTLRPVTIGSLIRGDAHVAGSKKKDGSIGLGSVFIWLLCVWASYLELRDHEYKYGIQTLVACVTVPVWYVAFFFPTGCGVRTRNTDSCGIQAYGFFFGCYRHRWSKLIARLGFFGIPFLRNHASVTLGPTRRRESAAAVADRISHESVGHALTFDRGIAIAALCVGALQLGVGIIALHAG